ncbi:MAG: hypothetical protein WC527_07020 [Candidatus Margulisiibacteriota bacterium]
MNLATLVPEAGIAGKKAVFQNSANRSQSAFNVLHLNGSRPVVHSVTTMLSEPERIAGIRDWFEARDCKIIESTPDTVSRADVVLTTKPKDGDTSISAETYRQAWDKAPKGTVFIESLSSRLLDGIFNHVHRMTESEMAVKMAAVQECRSQVDRTRFDEVQRDAARANALYSGVEMDSGYQYAENFKLAVVMPDGSIDLAPIWETKPSPWKGTAVCLSPHPDDYPIAVGGFGSYLTRLGWSVLDLVLTTSPRGVTDEFVKQNYPHIVEACPMSLLKEAIRMGETGRADAILGTTCRMPGLGFWARKLKDGSLDVKESEIVATKAMLEALTEGHLSLLAMPMQGDQHPAHIATHIMGMEIARRIARERGSGVLTAGYVSPWYNGGVETNAFNYFNPSREFKWDFPAAYYAQRALAEAGRELVAGFAAKPLDMRYYCQGDDVTAEGFKIVVKE